MLKNVQMLFVYYFENGVICSILVEWSRMLYANTNWSSRYIKWKKARLTSNDSINTREHKYTFTCSYIHKTFLEGNEKLLTIFCFTKLVNFWDERFAFNYIYFCHVWLFFSVHILLIQLEIYVREKKSHPNCAPN